MEGLDVMKAFFRWLSGKVTGQLYGALFNIYPMIEEYYCEKGVLLKPLFETTDMNIIQRISYSLKSDMEVKKYFRKGGLHSTAQIFIRMYLEFLRGVNSSTILIGDKANDNQNEPDDELKTDDFILIDLEFKQIKNILDNYKIIGVECFGKYFKDVDTWIDAYKYIYLCFINRFPKLFENYIRVKVNNEYRYVYVKSQDSNLLSKPTKLGNGYKIENLAWTQSIDVLRTLVTYLGVEDSDIVFICRRKSSRKSNRNNELRRCDLPKQLEGNEDRLSDYEEKNDEHHEMEMKRCDRDAFHSYLKNQTDLSECLRKKYENKILACEVYAEVNHLGNGLYDANSLEDAMNTANILLRDNSFLNYSSIQQDELSKALEKYQEFLRLLENQNEVKDDSNCNKEASEKNKADILAEPTLGGVQRLDNKNIGENKQKEEVLGDYKIIEKKEDMRNLRFSKADFFSYLERQANVAVDEKIDCKIYINVCESFIWSNKIGINSLYGEIRDSQEILNSIDELMNNIEFQKFNQKRSERLSRALNKYKEYIYWVIDSNQGEKKENLEKPLVSMSDKEKPELSNVVKGCCAKKVSIGKRSFDSYLKTYEKISEITRKNYLTTVQDCEQYAIKRLLGAGLYNASSIEDAMQTIDTLLEHRGFLKYSEQNFYVPSEALQVYRKFLESKDNPVKTERKVSGKSVSMNYIRELDEILRKLEKKYKNNPANSFQQVLKENSYAYYVDEMYKTVYGISAKKGLVDRGIISSDEKKSDNKKKLDKIVEKLQEKYREEKAISFFELRRDNPDINFDLVVTLVPKIYNKKVKDYFEEVGILRCSSGQNVALEHSEINKSDDNDITSEKVTRKTETALEDADGHKKIELILTQLENFYQGKTAESLQKVYMSVPDARELDQLTKNLYGVSPKEWLIEKGILLSDKQKLENLVELLKERYVNRKAESVYALSAENSDITPLLFVELPRAVYGKSSKVYFEEVGLIKSSDSNTSNTKLSQSTEKMIDEEKDYIPKGTVISKDEETYSQKEIVSVRRECQLAATEQIESKAFNRLIEIKIEDETAKVAVERIEKDATTYCFVKDDNLLFSLDKEELRHLQRAINKELANFKSSAVGFNQEEVAYIESFNTGVYFNYDDLKRAFKEKYPERFCVVFTVRNLNEIGYRILGNDIVVMDDIENVNQLLECLMFKNRVLDFSEDFWILKNSGVYNSLYQMKLDYDVVEFDKNKFLNIQELKKTGLTKNLLEDFCMQAISLMENKIFTIKFLRKQGFQHSLDDFGFDNYFYESIFRYHETVKASKYRGQYIFKKATKAISYSDLINEIILDNGAMDIYDVQQLLEEEYGIKMDMFHIRNFAKEGELYYSDTMEKIYLDYDDFFEEI